MVELHRRLEEGSVPDSVKSHWRMYVDKLDAKAKKEREKDLRLCELCECTYSYWQGHMDKNKTVWKCKTCWALPVVDPYMSDDFLSL